MGEAKMEQTVRVWGKSYTITVFQKHKTVWIAVGEYMGEHIEGKGSSAGSAIRAWVDAASYKGN
jgi:hypothetical protein